MKTLRKQQTFLNPHFKEFSAGSILKIIFIEICLKFLFFCLFSKKKGQRGLEEISLYLQLNEILRKSFYGIRDDRNLIYNNIPCEISICILVWKHSSINEEKTNILGKQ